MAVFRSSFGGVVIRYVLPVFIDDVIFAHKPRLLDVAAQLKRSALQQPWAWLLTVRSNTSFSQRTHGTTFRVLKVTSQVVTRGAESAVDVCPDTVLVDDAACRSRQVDGSRASVSLHGLLAGTAYHVRIVAVDCESRTRPSRWVTVETRAPTAAAAASQRQQRDHQHGTCVDTTARALNSAEYASEVTTLWRYTNLFIIIIIIIIIIRNESVQPKIIINDTIKLYFLKLQPAFWKFQTITVSWCCLTKLLPYILFENTLIF